VVLVLGRVDDLPAALADAQPFVIYLRLGDGASLEQVVGEAVGAGALARVAFAPLHVGEAEPILGAACFAVAARLEFESTGAVVVEQFALFELLTVCARAWSLAEAADERC
jgi:hypothetical protein